jgi:hypothetical protein
METASLKSFAMWARTALIREVSARFTVVLSPASPSRVEQPGVVDALEKAVHAAGGGDKGRTAVVDRVAYTWFNRIIALRFMDANGYTGVGVVSPQAGAESGQPEILAEAKRGNVDDTVVGTRTRETVTALLDGTRRSEDPQGEAYALLLADHCRYWNRAMPFMFEREGDFTELLIPPNLLADDSVLNRAIKVLTTDVCQDVEVIGWLYQFYISERKDEVFAGFKKNRRAGAAEIPAATQLFTPHWIVRYLVENSLGRLWMVNHPSSRLVDRMEFYIPPAEVDPTFLKISTPEEIRILDPACGSGHMLTYAFDLLYAIYEEEGYAPTEIPGLILANNLYGVEIDPRAGALAAFALTMKARGRQRTFFRKQVEPNVCVLHPTRFAPGEIDFLVTAEGGRRVELDFWNQFSHADTLGSLIRPDPEVADRLKRHVADLDARGDILRADVIKRAGRVVTQAEYLTRRYHVTIANPPYMGSKNMDAQLTEFAKVNYRNSKFDLFAMFIERCLEATLERGATAMITMQSWMFVSSYETLRESIVTANPPTTMVHLGERAFDSIGGSVVSTAAFVLERGGDAARAAIYVRVTDGDGESAKRRDTLEAVRDPANARRFVTSAAELAEIPGVPIAYWLSDAMRAAFTQGKPLGEIAQPREGLTSTDNNQFKRMWWEVQRGNTCLAAQSRPEARESRAKWFPINNGGGFRRWYGNADTLINWQDDGAALKRFVEDKFQVSYSKQIRSEQWYFLPSVSLGKIGTSDPSFRIYPHGFVADSASKNLYLTSELDELLVSGVGNSSVASVLLSAMAPTVNFTGQAIAALPYLDIPSVAPGVRALKRASQADWNDFETSWDFTRPSLLDQTAASLAGKFNAWSSRWREISVEQQRLESENNRLVAQAYGLEGEVVIEVPLHRVSLNRNVEFAYGPGRTAEQYATLQRADAMRELVSYAIGCMFGRFSLDKPGLVLADQGVTLQDYLAEVPGPTFVPDTDNVIPIVEGDWFEDDVVTRFRQFLRVAFGDQGIEENLRFVAESLGVKDIRDYFVKSFYKDHLQRYRKRPIYWLFSSPKGSFNALVYMHRYTPSTVSTVLNEYLREFRAKLTSSLQQQERFAASGSTPRQQAAAQKEADRLRKVLLELEEYEHSVLYPLASRQLAINLDDGVRANYPKFGAALRKIPGLEAADE